MPGVAVTPLYVQFMKLRSWWVKALKNWTNKSIEMKQTLCFLRNSFLLSIRSLKYLNRTVPWLPWPMRNSAIDTITCELDEKNTIVKSMMISIAQSKIQALAVDLAAVSITNTSAILLCYLISQKVAIGATGFHISMWSAWKKHRRVCKTREEQIT